MRRHASASVLKFLPIVDSDDHATRRRAELDLTRDVAAALGHSAVAAVQHGFYITATGQRVDISEAVSHARARIVSLPPDAALPPPSAARFDTTVVQVTNETTLAAAQRLSVAGLRPAALNFANGISPGGGFLGGARAQEEAICRSSALYATLAGDAMYDHHAARGLPDSTDWVIVSPAVPVFRSDEGAWLQQPWSIDILTCAAPYAPQIGQPRSGDLLQQRIARVLAVAAAYGYDTLVLGAWGCGAFGNDPERTARDFRAALEGPAGHAFRHVVFAIADWSAERRFLGPFARVFC